MARRRTDDHVQVAVSDLTDRQLLLHILELQRDTLARIKTMENKVADLTVAVDELKASVDGVAQRLLPQIDALETALADAQADDAVAAEVLAEAVTAAAAIRVEAQRLNVLGADPETPIDPDPVDPIDPPPVEP